MTKIERSTQKVFAGNANNEQLAVFGSMKTGNPIYTDNIIDLQSEDYLDGWQAAIVADEAPFMEEMNGVQYGFSKQLAYLFQEGIPEYDANTTYYKGSAVKRINSDITLEIFFSIEDENLNNSLDDEQYWKKWNPAGDLSTLANIDLSNLSVTGQAIIDNKANTSLNNLAENAAYNIIKPNTTQLKKYSAGMLLVTSDRTYYKTNDGECIAAVVSINNYFSPMLIGKTNAAVQQHNSYDTTPSNGTPFTYKGETWYYNAGTGAFLVGTTSSYYDISRVPGNFTDPSAAAVYILDLYLNSITNYFPKRWGTVWSGNDREAGYYYDLQPNGSIEMGFRYKTLSAGEEVVLAFPFELSEVDYFVFTGNERSSGSGTSYPYITARSRTSITFKGDSNALNYITVKGKAA